jgi:hypothetical protein
MAVAGSMTTAYTLRAFGDTVYTERTTYPAASCTPPAAAVDTLRHWTAASKPPIVQGSDMATFWRLWNGEAD